MGISVSKTTNSEVYNAINEVEIPSLDVHSKLEEVERLVKEFRNLQVQYADTLECENLTEKIDAVERWAESYRRGLKAALKISQNGQDMLEEVRSRLKLAADELTRFSSESPNPSPKGEGKKTEAFLEATRSIDALLPAVEHVVTQNENQNNEAEDQPQTDVKGE